MALYTGKSFNQSAKIVLINGSPLTSTVTSNATHTGLYITNTQGTHKVEIIGTTVIPESPSTTIMPTLMMAMAALITYLRKKIREVS